MAITIPVREELQSDEGYAQFVSTLQCLFNLTNPSGDGSAPAKVRWAAVSSGSEVLSQPPNVRFSIAPNHPSISVVAQPYNDGKQIGHDEYNVPLLIRDVQRWETVGKALKAYALNGWIGRDEKDEHFQQQRTLEEVLRGNGINISLSTPVVEAAVLLPSSANREYATEFYPVLTFEHCVHAHYKVLTIAEDKVTAHRLLSEGALRVPVKRHDKDLKEYNWSSDAFHDLSALDRALSPSSTGHMIIIAAPYSERKTYSDSAGYPNPNKVDGQFPPRGRSGGYQGPFDPNFKSARPGMVADDVRIGRGSQTGQSYLHTGKLEDTLNGNPAIFHLKLIAVKPEQAITIDDRRLELMAGSLATYQISTTT